MAESTTFVSIEKENVVIRAGSCAITVLPQFGGKIASIRFNQQELLQAPLAPIATRTRTMSFDAGDASGWDECLPSVASCALPLEHGVANIPDHGDLWRVPWQETHGNGNSVSLRAECFSLPLELERELTLKKSGRGYGLYAAYKLTNVGEEPVPWSWASHPLFAAVAGDRIVLPPTIRNLLVEGSRHDRLGRSGETIGWPIATIAGGKADLRVARGAASGIGDKLFAGPLSAEEDWCALERPSIGVRIRVRFNTVENPYLGLWICFGGWPEGSGKKQMCVAMEPSTAPVDSLVKKGPWSRVLEPRQSALWGMHVDLELL
jgi:galactose mutarotase-like enzyme